MPHARTAQDAPPSFEPFDGSDDILATLPEAYEKEAFSSRMWQGYGREILASRRRLLPLPEKRFFIFAQGRTGSTLLTSSLDSHSRIRCEDEILRLPRFFPIRFAEDRARAARAGGAQCFGFHVKCYQLWKWQRVKDLGVFVSAMHARGWKVIYLSRQNLFEHVVSSLFAEASDRYHVYNGDKSAGRQPIHIEPDELMARLRKRVFFLRHERAALKAVPYLEITYEDDLVDDGTKQTTFERIQEYIGVPVEPLQVRMSKVVNRSLGDLIVNYDEVVGAVSGTEFERFLPAKS